MHHRECRRCKSRNHRREPGSVPARGTPRSYQRSEYQNAGRESTKQESNAYFLGQSPLVLSLLASLSARRKITQRIRPRLTESKTQPTDPSPLHSWGSKWFARSCLSLLRGEIDPMTPSTSCRLCLQNFLPEVVITEGCPHKSRCQ